MPEIGDIKYIKGRKRIFAFNPEKGIARYYGVKTIYSRSYITSKELVEQNFKSESMNKARALRENIIDTVRTKISESFNEYALVDDVTSILNTFSDDKLADFAEKNKDLIGYFFSYDDSTINTSDMDARLFLLLKKLGIDPYNHKYIGDMDKSKEGYDTVKHNLQIEKIDDFMELKKVELGVSKGKYYLGNK